MEFEDQMASYEEAISRYEYYIAGQVVMLDKTTENGAKPDRAVG